MSQNLEQNNNPSFDWDLSVKLAGNKPELAREMLILFAKNLQEEMNAIHAATELFKMDEILSRIHKLHGAASYCGVPKLKMILADCELSLKKKRFADFKLHYPDLESEAKVVAENVTAFIP